MKKFLLALTLALLLCVPAMAAEQRFGLVHNSSTVNLREMPTQHSDWLGAYASGEWVEILAESGNWYRVLGPDGKTGYMSRNYVRVDTLRYGPVGVVNNGRATAFLNLRAAPSMSARVIDIYYDGVPCLLLNQSGGWYHVRVDGVEGYFREEYILRRQYACGDEVATIVTPGNTALNLRTGPGMRYPSAGQFPGGRYVMVLQKGSDWWHVSVDGKTGFMSAEFLRDGILKPGGAAGGEMWAEVSNPKPTQVLNLRDRPDASGKVLGQFRNGVRLTVLAQGTEWCHVSTAQGLTGYMMTRYLTLSGAAQTPTMRVVHPGHTFINLRLRPSMLTGAVLTTVPHGAQVRVLAPASNGWVKIYYNGYTGYAVDYFLE